MGKGKTAARSAFRSRIVGDGEEAPDQLLVDGHARVALALRRRVAPISRVDADRVVRSVHYSGKVVNNSQLHFGVFLRGRLEGAMQFGPVLPFDRIDALGAGMYRGERVTRSSRAKDQDVGHPPALGGETPTRTLQSPEGG